MATRQGFIDHVQDQAGLGARLSARKMFGEYGIYLDGRMVALACDDSLFVRPLVETEALTAKYKRKPPYPGAKPHPVIDELLDDADALRELLQATAKAMPAPKPKKTPTARAAKPKRAR